MKEDSTEVTARMPAVAGIRVKPPADDFAGVVKSVCV
jgi:hypothetical protein